MSWSGKGGHERSSVCWFFSLGYRHNLVVTRGGPAAAPLGFSALVTRPGRSRFMPGLLGISGHGRPITRASFWPLAFLGRGTASWPLLRDHGTSVKGRLAG